MTRNENITNGYMFFLTRIVDLEIVMTDDIYYLYIICYR